MRTTLVFCCICGAAATACGFGTSYPQAALAWDAAYGRDLVQVKHEVARTRANATPAADVDLEVVHDAISATRALYGSPSRGKPLQWESLRQFPPIALQQPAPSCQRIGRQYPQLTSRNLSVLDSYADYACGDGSNYFLTDPAVGLNAELAELHGGCVNMMRWPRSVFAANSTHFTYAFRTSEHVTAAENSEHALAPILVDHDVLVISSSHLPAGMEYQHTLLDFLPAAWTVAKILKGSSKRLVTHIPIQRAMLQYLGISEANMLELPFPKHGQAFLLCTAPHKILQIWRTGRGDGGELPTKHYRRGGFADFWHRLLNYQVGHELSDAIAKNAGWMEDALEGNQQITFLQRCVVRRRLANEQEALALTSRALIASNRSEGLMSLCAGRLTWLEQVSQVRKSALIMGAHGGAIANILFARPGTGVIEIVGSPKAAKIIDAKGEWKWPPYKSHWYGGAGASLSFFRVVLYEPNAAAKLEVRLDDLEEALQQWFVYKNAQDEAENLS